MAISDKNTGQSIKRFEEFIKAYAPSYLDCDIKHYNKPMAFEVQLNSFASSGASKDGYTPKDVQLIVYDDFVSMHIDDYNWEYYGEDAINKSYAEITKYLKAAFEGRLTLMGWHIGPFLVNKHLGIIA